MSLHLISSDIVAMIYATYPALVNSHIGGGPTEAACQLL